MDNTDITNEIKTNIDRAVQVNGPKADLMYKTFLSVFNEKRKEKLEGETPREFGRRFALENGPRILFDMLIRMSSTSCDRETAIINFYYDPVKNQDIPTCHICGINYVDLDICRVPDSPCTHVFHAECICRLTECPICHVEVRAKLATFDEIKEFNGKENAI
jgi:hypothetical protein